METFYSKKNSCGPTHMPSAVLYTSAHNIMKENDIIVYLLAIIYKIVVHETLYAWLQNYHEQLHAVYMYSS